MDSSNIAGWILSRVGSFTQGRAYYGRAGNAKQQLEKDDVGSLKPYIMVHQLYLRQDGRSLDGAKGASEGLYQVKVITESAGFATADPIANGIIAALDNQTGTVGTTQIIKCLYQEEVSYQDPRSPEGKSYNHLGANFYICALSG